jgi:hypothetical protein
VNTESETSSVRDVPRTADPYRPTPPSLRSVSTATMCTRTHPARRSWPRRSISNAAITIKRRRPAPSVQLPIASWRTTISQ